MPEYTIGLPDGRKMRLEAASESEAIAGAQAWWTQQQAAGPVIPNGPGNTPAAGARAAAGTQSHGLPEDEAQEAQWRAMGWLPREENPNAADVAQKFGQGFFANWGDEIAATAGSLPNVLTGGRYGKPRAEILREIRQRERDFDEAFPGLAASAEVAGGVTGALGAGGTMARAAGVAPGFLRSVGAGVAAGAPLGAADRMGRIEGPADAATYAREGAEGAAISGALGGVTGGLGNLAGRAINPIASRAAEILTRQGVRLTPGEVIGGNAQRLEDAVAAMPFIGGMVRNRAREGVDSLNQAAYQQVLAPLGPRAARYMRGVEPGHASARRITDVFNRGYGRVVPRMTAEVDAQLTREIDHIRRGLPAGARGDFDGMVDHYVNELVDPSSGRILGEQLQGALEGLREHAKAFRAATANPYHRDVGTALGSLRESLTQAAERHSAPGDVAAFRRLQSAYRRFRPVRAATAGVATDRGTFSAAQLHNAVRAADESAGKGATARGEAVLQGLSGPARAVMTPKAAGSPTAERLAIMSALSGAGGLAAYQNPEFAGVGVVPAALLAALYSRPGARAFQRFATGPRRAARAAIVRRAIQASALPGEAFEGNE